MSISKSGAFGPDGVTQYFDTLTVDQSLLTDGDVGTHSFAMRVYHDPGEYDDTSACYGYTVNEITYDFRVTVGVPIQCDDPE